MSLDSLILDAETLSKVKRMIEKEKYLNEHPFELYQGKNGKWRTYILDGGKRRQIQRKSKEELEDAVIQYYRQLDIGPSFNDIFNEWNDSRAERGRIREATATRYRTDFLRFFDEFGQKPVKHTYPEEIADFLEDQLTRYELTAKGFSNLKTLMRGVLKRAKKLKLIDYPIDSIFKDLDISEKDFRKPIVLDSKEIFFDDERELILDYCKKHWDDDLYLGIILIFVTGLRVGELVTLKRNDILEDEIFVHRTETKYRKDGQNIIDVEENPKTAAGMRRVLVPSSYKWVLDCLRRDGSDKFVFIGPNGKRVPTGHIRAKLERLCKKLDIPPRPPHKARKTYGTILLDNRVDNKFIEKQMGHTDILTTELHYHRDRKRVDQKLKILNQISEFS